MALSSLRARDRFVDDGAERGGPARRAGVKRCFTKPEWDMIAEREQTVLKKTMDQLGEKSSGN